MKLLYRSKNSFVGPIHHKRDPRQVVEEDATECESEKDSTLAEQLAELRSTQAQILKSQERMEMQLANILDILKSKFAHPALQSVPGS